MVLYRGSLSEKEEKNDMGKEFVKYQLITQEPIKKRFRRTRINRCFFKKGWFHHHHCFLKNSKNRGYYPYGILTYSHGTMPIRNKRNHLFGIIVSQERSFT